MADSFVDVTYRGLEVGKRVKLRDVRAEVGYLEVPLPMPVGTRISLDTGEGLHIEAFVTSVHEQVGGSDLVAGMKVRPTLAGAPSSKAASWWQARVDAAASAAEAEADAKAADAARKIAEQAARAEAEAKAKAEVEAARVAAEAEAKAKVEAEAARAVPTELVPEESGKKRNGKRNGGRSGVGRARSDSGAHDAVEATPPPAQGSGRATVVMSSDAVKAALAAEGISTDDDIVDDGKRTEAMAAVDPEAIEAAAAEAAAPFPSPPAEEGKRTVMMDAIDISMITGEPTTDIGAGAANGDDDDVEMTIESDDGEEPSPSASGKLPAAGDKQRKSGKRRKKR